MTNDVINTVLKAAESLGTSNSFELRVQLDELIHLVEICEKQLPVKFVKLVKDADKSPPTTSALKILLKDRLQSSLKMQELFPIPQRNDEVMSNSDLAPEFELSKSEKARVFELCTAMRKIVFASEVFDDPHKQRLLNRIAAIEKEVHQTFGKLDTVLAGVVDVGDALGKFGRKVEPLTKRMKEVAEIARGGSKQYDQIPAPDEPLGLPSPDEE